MEPLDLMDTMDFPDATAGRNAGSTLYCQMEGWGLEVEVPSLASKDTEGFMALFISVSRRIGIGPGPPWVPSTGDKWNYLSLEIPTERLGG